ncbi:MAG: gliding motility-associated C-terminal domain-containing protein, partial [Flavobacteriaceae bacterium]|nr:gliding motility-associated C-terminal domain-containing protein [Flavobacteriaceae bacterium]
GKEYEVVESVDPVSGVKVVKVKLVEKKKEIWVDENGKPLTPNADGTIAGYEFVKTVTDENGIIKHIYKKKEKVCPPPVDKVLTTEWVDTDGKPLKDKETGKTLSDVGKVDGYTFINAVVDTEGNIKYIFEKKNDCEGRKTEFIKSIPQGFSPNGDGKNELFKIKDLETCFPTFRLRVYNRWGNLVYDYSNEED